MEFIGEPFLNNATQKYSTDYPYKISTFLTKPWPHEKLCIHIPLFNSLTSIIHPWTIHEFVSELSKLRILYVMNSVYT